MTVANATAPSPGAHPLPVATPVTLDSSVSVVGDSLITGGQPWRTLRLNPAAVAHVRDWATGGTVRAANAGLARTMLQHGMLRAEFTYELSAQDVTVVIPVWRDAVRLASLLPQLRVPHVIVVDDGSPNGDAVRDVATRHGASYVRLEQNTGPATARNVGVANATTPFILTLDVDTVVEDVTELLTRLGRHFGDPLVGAVAPRVRGAEATTSFGRFESSHSPLDLGPEASLVTPRGRVSYVPSAALLLRREAFGTGFNESLRVGEDVDFVWGLTAHGWNVQYDPSVVVRHHARNTTSSWLRQRASYGRSAAALAERHPGRLHPVHVDAWTLLAWVGVLLRRPFLTAFATSTARRGLRQQLPADLDDRRALARTIVNDGIQQAGGPLARAVVRSYFPLLLVALLHPRTRRGALTIVLGGIWWRFHKRAPRHLTDLPLAALDDLAYAVGVWHGAVERRQWEVVTPRVTGLSRGLRALVGYEKSPSPTTRVDEGLRSRND